MFRFAIRMMIVDLHEAFKGFWIYVYFGVLSLVIGLPFYDSNPFTQLYVSIATLSVLTPQLPKILYVLPLENKVIRRYIHLRSIITAFLLSSIGGIFTLISFKYPVPHLEQGWLWLTFYVQVCLLLGMIITKAGKKISVLLYSLMGILLLGNFINICFLSNFKIQILISIGFMFASEMLLLFVLKTYKLGNYTEPRYGYLNLFKRNTR
jgi:hypothetical protein